MPINGYMTINYEVMGNSATLKGIWDQFICAALLLTSQTNTIGDNWDLTSKHGDDMKYSMRCNWFLFIGNQTWLARKSTHVA